MLIKINISSKNKQSLERCAIILLWKWNHIFFGVGNRWFVKGGRVVYSIIIRFYSRQLTVCPTGNVTIFWRSNLENIRTSRHPSQVQFKIPNNLFCKVKKSNSNRNQHTIWATPSDPECNIRIWKYYP
jgi:hypothetical protein